MVSSHPVYNLAALINDRDQELRFTVHDSPDYYNLKVSVFNDDKKTELIGETWIALDAIVKPGGGSNDVWHHLNCKGKFAGEIRIELTYYDTRPREDKPVERRQSAPIDSVNEPEREGVLGPRQPKPVKRRPLPADPTNSAHSSPLPYTPQANSPQLSGPQQRYVEPSDDYGFPPSHPRDNRHQRGQSSRSHGSPLSQQYHGSYDAAMTTTSSPGRPNPVEFDGYSAANQVGYDQAFSEEYNPGEQYETLHDQPLYDNEVYAPTAYEPRLSTGLPASIPPRSIAQPQPQRPMAQPLKNPQSMVHSHSSPAIAAAQHSPRSSLSQPGNYDASSMHPRSRHNSHEAWSSQYDKDLQDGAAPPPTPVHRISGHNPLSPPVSRGQSETYGPITPTAPLNIRNERVNISGSPLTQVLSTSSEVGYPLSASPSNSQLSSQPPPASSRTSYSQAPRRRSQSPIRDYGSTMPPSLMPGYEPSIADDESERILHEQRMSTHRPHSDRSALRYQKNPATAPIQQTQAQPIPRTIDNVQERRAHRSSAPVTRQQPNSPDPRTPVRKSVSPQPDSAPGTRRPSEIPFGPDSYDTFNPSISASNSVNQTGPKYNTPEQAKEAAFQHERESKLPEGPIIGNDGRIIDPSDHLPTDTWAPEPEQKVPRKGPEVTVRFRHSPQGAQPMPQSARRPLSEARPNTLSSPIYAYSTDNVTTPPTTRARLQKKSALHMAQPASSPLVPTLNTVNQRAPMRDNRGFDSSPIHSNSPIYGNRSPVGIPPPIPGKVPIGSGQEDWGMSALSEEMSRIDIGVGGGQRSRRSRYGL